MGDDVRLAIWLVRLAGLYLAAGLVFGIPFIMKGAGAIDPDARQGTWGFRLLILPGAVALWPFLLRRWARGDSMPPTEHNAHRTSAGRS